MKKNRRPSHGPLLAALGATFLTACGFGDVDLKWSEEVQLADGQVIVIQRTAKGEVQGEGFRWTGWVPTETTFAFKGLPTSIKPPPEWSTTQYTPILLDYEAATNTWAVVAAFNNCFDWIALGKPAPPYVEYRSDGGTPWRVVPLEQRLIGRDRNLLTGPSSHGEPAIVTVESKRIRGGNSADFYKRVIPGSSRSFC